MKILYLKYTLLFILTTGFISCDKEDAATNAATLDAFLKAEARLSIFSKALDKAGLESFKNGPGPFTWFAPTNEAFTAALITEDSLNKMTPGQVNYIILYHLANARLTSSDMIATNSAPRNSQLGSGASQMYIGSVKNESYVNGSKIISRDNAVSNGYVHILNRVNVHPNLVGNIQRILTETGQHSLFIQALTKANLWTAFGSASVFTIFAPTDAAMTAAGYTNASITAANVTTLGTAMRLHYISNIRLFTNDLNRATLPATAAGASSYITPSENGTKLKAKNNPTPVTIAKSDILGTNGVVHIIDGILK